MPNPNAIYLFLQESLGYRRITDAVSGVPRQVIPIRGQLEGTILGTYGASTVRPGKSGLPGEFELTDIDIPRIHPRSELEEQIAANRTYAATFRENPELSRETRDRRYFLATFPVFVRYSGAEIKDWIGQIHNRLFPEADYSFTVKGRYKAHIKASDFYFFSAGSTAKKAGKVLVVAFDLSDEIVQEINRACEQIPKKK